jgi:hypothetical protein
MVASNLIVLFPSHVHHIRLRVFSYFKDSLSFVLLRHSVVAPGEVVYGPRASNGAQCADLSDEDSSVSVRSGTSQVSSFHFSCDVFYVLISTTPPPVTL